MPPSTQEPVHKVRLILAVSQTELISEAEPTFLLLEISMGFKQDQTLSLQNQITTTR
jgi:hypothetical protein